MLCEEDVKPLVRMLYCSYRELEVLAWPGVGMLELLTAHTDWSLNQPSQNRINQREPAG